MARTRGTGRRTASGRSSSARTAGRRARREEAGASTARGGADAAHVLKRQHDETRVLFRKLASAQGDARRSTFLELADALAAHATVEERLLYPEMARHDETADLARDAVEEHLVMKRLLADMLESNLPAEVFDAKCRVVEDEVSRHVEEEEAILLPLARKLLGRERMSELGREIERTFTELMRHEPRSSLPREAEGAPVFH